MPRFCCVVGCACRGDRDNVSFFKIPKESHYRHRTDLNELSRLRREKWLNAIRRQDFTETKIKYAFVCAKHFISGKPAELIDTLNPDWVPSLQMGYQTITSEVGIQKLQRYKRKKLISIEAVAEVDNNEVDEPSSSCEELQSISQDIDNCKSVQTALSSEDITNLKLEIHSARQELQRLSRRVVTFKSLKDDDAKTRYYTALHSYKVFIIVIDIIKPYIKVTTRTILPPEEQILLTLMKLRLNLDFKDLAYRFGVSASTASRYFKDTIHIMCSRMKGLIFWPERAVLQKTMPTCFKEAFQDKTTVIIDCFEIRCQIPSDLLSAAQSWSNYKHSQTIKYLIGITPQGSVCFISEGWGGRASDKIVTANSAFLKYLHPGDVVMADRGFLIKEFVEVFGATVKTPAFTKGHSQLYPVDLEESRNIAHCRIHIERIIGSLRQKYSILHEILPISLLSTASDVPLLDEILCVCCALINLCPPIIPL